MSQGCGNTRIGVVFGGAILASDAVLIEGDRVVTAAAVERFRVAADLRHPAGCVCCAPRGPVAEALGRLFLARARGDVAWFSRVVVVAGAEGEAAVRAALSADVVTMARFVARFEL